MPEKLNFQDGELLLLSNFWDCECPTDFIHRKSTTPACEICHCSHDEQPDSRAQEILLSASHLLSAEECKEIADKIGSQKKLNDGLYLYYEACPTHIFLTEQARQALTKFSAHVMSAITDAVLYDRNLGGEESVLWSIRSTKGSMVYVFAYQEDEENKENDSTKDVLFEKYFDRFGIADAELLLTSSNITVLGYGLSIVFALDGEQL